ncbi:MAG: DNA adenine methylase, partial [Bacteroidetes bacterium]
PHTWLMTYDNCEYIKNLFSFAHVNDWSLTYGMRNQTKNSTQIGKEVFISNFPIQLIQNNAEKLQITLY